jgi:hypothetical protein
MAGLPFPIAPTHLELSPASDGTMEPVRAADKLHAALMAGQDRLTHETSTYPGTRKVGKFASPPHAIPEVGRYMMQSPPAYLFVS